MHVARIVHRPLCIGGDSHHLPDPDHAAHDDVVIFRDGQAAVGVFFLVRVVGADDVFSGGGVHDDALEATAQAGFFYSFYIDFICSISFWKAALFFLQKWSFIFSRSK